MTKTHLRTLIGNDDLDQVIQGLLRFADQYSMPEVRSDALIQSGRLEDYKKQLRIGAVAYESLAQNRAAVRSALLNVVEALPDKPVEPDRHGRLPGMSEKRFKNSLFWLILFGQLLILLWLWFQLDTGGFSPKEVAATLTLLISVFTAYLMPMYQDMLKNRYINILERPYSEKRISWSLPILTYLIILPAYFGLLFYFIHMRGNGKWGFDDFTTGLALLSTGLGAYVATLINTIVKKTAD